MHIEEFIQVFPIKFIRFIVYLLCTTCIKACKTPFVLSVFHEMHMDFKWLFITSLDRKSTRLNSSHVSISYAVFCLNKKNELANKVSECSKLTISLRDRNGQ